MTRATRSGSAGAAGQEPGSQGMGHRYGSRVLWKRFTAAVNLIINISTSLSLPHFLVISRYCSLHGYRPMTNWKNLKRPLSSAAENLKGPALDTRNAAVSPSHVSEALAGVLGREQQVDLQGASGRTLSSLGLGVRVHRFRQERSRAVGRDPRFPALSVWVGLWALSLRRGWSSLAGFPFCS